MINADLVSLLTIPTIRNVFIKVAQERTIRFRDLQHSLGIKRDEAVATLNKLKEAKLIKEQGAPVDDFATFYVTAAGISVERQLRNLR